MRLEEVWAGLKYLAFKNADGMENQIDTADASEDVHFCDEMLGKVSRSFSAVIRQLPKGLALEILIFYLTLRALDTVEDDMEAFIGK